ncbi:hypothetical protein [Burkholderia diffusa]|uniref:hypothetical protein n=1 Tax=Burkholderia diffusa TaxID=488732 RepID=UPI000A3D8DEA|nr:hypothetical protein [Burkholderia diffusa]
MNKSKQKGFGMVDMAVAVMVAGALMGVFTAIQQAAKERNAVVNVNNLYSRIDNATVAFAQLNGRLPCPASDDKGVENCGGATSGQVPYVTIGVPDYEAASVTYSVAPYATNDGTSVDLRKISAPTVLQFQMSNQPTASVEPVTSVGPNGRRYDLLGLCEAVERPRASAYQGAQAYTLSRVSLASGFGIVPGYYVSVDDLAARLACGALVSDAARGYFNTVATYAASLRNFLDYLYYSFIELKVAIADLIDGIALVKIGMLKDQEKQYELQSTIAVCQEDSAKCRAVVFAAIDLTTQESYEALNLGRLVRYIINLAYAQEDYNKICEIVAETTAQLAAVQNRALESAAGGVYAP